MRVPLNLASEPFRRDRQILVASAATAALLLIGLVVLTSLAISERHRAEEARTQLSTVDNDLARIRREQARLDSDMRRPDNEIVLDRSVLINSLIRRKAISWTKIFSDLETVLPNNVRVIAIRPQANARDQLFLDMTVAADSPEPVIAFIQKLEGSDVFGSTAVSVVTAPTQNDPTFRYRLSVNYAQKL